MSRTFSGRTRTNTGRIMISAFTFKLLTALTVAATALACEDDHAHDHAHTHTKRLNPSSPLTPPSRPLVWGDFNIIHTTDTHGWLLGHQKPSFPEPNYRYASVSIGF